jgi:hypothetical protein
MPSETTLREGLHVEALVKHITSDAAAKRYYGADWDKRRCSGIIKKVDKVLPNARSKVRQTIITATYVLPDGRMKDVALNRRSVIIVSLQPSEQNNGATTSNVSANPLSNPILNQLPTATSPRPRLTEMPSASPQRESSIRIAGTAATSNSLQSENNDNATNTTLTPPSNPPESSSTAIIHQVATTTIVDPTATANNIRPIDSSTSHQPLGSVLNSINMVALGNPNIVQVPHGCIWEKSTAQDVVVAPDLPSIQWYWIDNFGEKIYPSSRNLSAITRLQIFNQVFPKEQLSLILSLTNEKITVVRGKKLTEGELIKFFGIVILATRFEFAARRDLWSQTKKTKYEEAPAFGRTGMSRNRFDQIWSSLTFSKQTEKTSTMTWEEHRWMLIDDFISNFNKHRATYYYPSEKICVDESISRWYGLGGSWIDVGLPTYVAMERKPENGCEIQNCCDGKSGIMLQLRVVKSCDADAEESDDGLNHGTKILLDLVKPWWNKTRRVVCADSYFSSVQTVIACRSKGLQFIGVVKTATKSYPMNYLSRVPLTDRGKHHVVIHKADDGIVDMAAFVWVDRERRYFVSNTSSLQPGNIIERQRWRQLDSEEGGAARTTTLTEQPKCVELYYSACAMIDRHNRCRQDTLGIEKKIGTLDWDKRVNFSVL